MTALGRMALLAAMPVLAAAPAAAQDGCVRLGSSAAADSARAPTVLIRATAGIRELRFETRPRTEVRTAGCAGLDGVTVTERVNLPDPVEPGVTYRDVRVGMEIRAHLDVVCLPALAADPAFAALCGSAAPASAAPPLRQRPTQQQPPNAPAPANPPRR
ncbi:MAG TPA: hypothetical protein VK358_00940 [Longimicrobium sp.]|nr:hypothetical protein [Longimicrobium sp.]